MRMTLVLIALSSLLISCASIQRIVDGDMNRVTDAPTIEIPPSSSYGEVQAPELIGSSELVEPGVIPLELPPKKIKRNIASKKIVKSSVKSKKVIAKKAGTDCKKVAKLQKQGKKAKKFEVAFCKAEKNKIVKKIAARTKKDRNIASKN